MNTQHTPGPWTVMPRMTHPWYDIKAAEWQVAEVETDPDAPDESEANARLIAAAPDLLAALRECAILAEYGTTGPGKCKSDALTAEKATALRLAVSTICRAAIQKAEGV